MQEERPPHNVFRSRRQRIAIGVTAVVGLVLTLVVVLLIRNLEQERGADQFQSQARDYQDSIYYAMVERLFVLQATQRIFNCSVFVSRDEFTAYTELYIKRIPGIQALCWVPKVEAEDRNEVEILARRDGVEFFQITELGPNRTIVPADANETYFPVFYAEPYGGNETILGYDLGSSTALRHAMRRAQEENRIVGVNTDFLSIQNLQSPSLAVFIIPVYVQGTVTYTLAGRRKNLKGFIVGMFRILDMVQDVIPDQPRDNIQIEIWDETSPEPYLFYSSDPAGTESSKARPYRGEYQESEKTVEIGMRTWGIVCRKPREGFWAGLPGGVYAILGVGGVITTLMALYLRSVFRGADYVKALVNKRTEELRNEIAEREQTQQQLHASLSFQQKLMDISLTGVFTVDRNGIITSVNEAMTEMTGYSSKEFLGRTCEFLACSHFGRVCPLFDPSRTEPIRKVECTICRKDGKPLTILKSGEVLRDETGEITGGVISAVDVTELVAARKAAESATVAKSEFLARMSHEIRTPMTGVMGMTELALQTDLTAEQEKYLTMVRTSSESLLRIIDDILDFSKIEAGKFELDRIEFDLRELIGGTLAALGYSADEKGVELMGDIDPELPHWIVGDPDRLRQVLNNLIGNAIKFTDEGEIVVSVQEKSRNNRSLLLLFSVRDTGIGISRQDQEKVFGMFEQVDGSRSRKYGGTGLGLSITTQLIHMMHGTIWLESVPGEGTTFYFTVRVDTSSRFHEPPAGKLEQLQDLRVLVVDDNQTNRKVLDTMLRHWRMQPTLAGSGEEGLNLLKEAHRNQREYPLVLLDADMPSMDGFALAERIKSDPLLCKSMVLMLSSSEQREQTERCRALGIPVYLIKPVRHSALLDAIVETLNIQPASPTPSVSEENAPSSVQSLDARILLVEDNKVNQVLAKTTLELFGCEVVLAENGQEALSALEIDSFDLILMDIEMPVMNGLDATRAIRERERETQDHVPIIAMTAHALVEDQQRCLRAGMDKYISKPVHSNILYQMIANTLKEFRTTS